MLVSNSVSGGGGRGVLGDLQNDWRKVSCESGWGVRGRSAGVSQSVQSGSGRGEGNTHRWEGGFVESIEGRRPCSR